MKAEERNNVVSRENRSKLTELERSVSIAEVFDFASGYPRLLKRRNRLNCIISGLSQRSLRKSIPLQEGLFCAKVRALLTLRSDVWLRPTLTGSVGLERCIRVLADRVSRIVLPSAVFDVIPALISESNKPIAYFNLERLRDEDISAAIGELSAGGPIGVILVSPSNPYGWVAQNSYLNTLCGALANHAGILLVDHSFALVGRHCKRVPVLPNCSSENSHWLFVWDTGKTFDMDGAKLGIVGASASLSGAVDDALNVIQGELPLYVLEGCIEAARSALETSYLRELSSLISTNGGRMADAFGVERTSVPDFGAFGILRLTGDADEFCRIAFQLGLGLVSTKCFWQVPHVPHNEIRIPLTRNRKDFEEGIRRLLSVAEAVALR